MHQSSSFPSFSEILKLSEKELHSLYPECFSPIIPKHLLEYHPHLEENRTITDRDWVEMPAHPPLSESEKYEIRYQQYREEMFGRYGY